ncbi:glycerate dehydrogenase [Spirochaetota bacterium]|nr:glycerate dehydrogenase [Spirochaetota bacterium]
MLRKIVFLDRGTIPPHVTFPSLGVGYEWKDYNYTQEAELISRLKDAAVCVVNKINLREQTLSQLPALKMIALTATGSNNIDLAYCKKRGIAVSNIVNYGTPSIAEHVFALILALKRNLLTYREAAFTQWSKGVFFTILHYPITELHGSVLGVIGKGTLGRAVGALGSAFGMKVLYSERKQTKIPRAGYTAFPTVLKEADILTLHTPLVKETQSLIGEQELQLMKSSAILINTARGGIVDEKALVAALHAKTIAGAGIDVTIPEPPHETNVLLSLKEMPNVILTPHIAWGGENSLRQVSIQVVENISAFFAGTSKRRLV